VPWDPRAPIGLLDDARGLAVEAGQAILAVYRHGFRVEEKSDQTPVTSADMAAHRVLNDGLARLSPSLPVLSEESGPIAYRERSRWTTYWLVDPLDGTREFIRHNDEFSVNVSLVHRHEAVLGVIHAPALGRSYFACRGHGARRVDGDQPAAPIHVRTPTRTPPVVTASRSHASDGLDAYLEHLGDYELITMGSALKSCLIAEGSADLYLRLGPTSEWDTAAAQCLVEEAGGAMVDTNGRPLRYNMREDLTNPSFLVYGDADRDWLAWLRGGH